MNKYQFYVLRREEDYQEFVNSYWSRDMDHSCQQFAFDSANNISNPWELCGILSKSLPFVETDMFIMVSLRDPVFSGGYGCPEPGLEEEIFVPWRDGDPYPPGWSCNTLRL